MPIAYRAAGTGTTGAAATSITTNLPAGVTDGDALIWTWSGNAGTLLVEPPTPTGWARLSTFQVVGAGPSQAQISWFRWAKSEPANYVISGLAAGRYSAHILAFTGVDSIAFEDVTETQATVTGTDVSNPAITPVTPGAWILAEESVMTASGVTTVTYSSSNATQVGTICGTSGTTANSALGAAYLDTWASGAFTPNLVPTGTNQRGCATTFALRPAAAGVATRQTIFAPRRAPTRFLFQRPVSVVAAASGINIDLDPAVLTLTGVDPTAAGTGVSATTVDVAALTLTGVDPTVAGSSAATQTVDVAALTLTGVTPSTAGSGASSTVVDPAVLTLSGVDVTVAGTGAASQTVDVAILVLSGVDVTVSAGAAAQNIDLDPATLVLSGVDLTVSGSGAASVTVDVAALTLVGITPTAAGTGVGAIIADAATLTLTGVTPTTAGAGAASQAVDSAVLTLTGVELVAIGLLPDTNPITLTIRDTGHTTTVRGERTRTTARSAAATTVRTYMARLTQKPSTRTTAKENRQCRTG